MNAVYSMGPRLYCLSCSAVAPLLFALVVFQVGQTRVASAQCPACVYPDSSWHHANNDQLESMGWSVSDLSDLSEFVRDSTNITGLFVVDAGFEVFEFGDVAELSYVASVRKSILSLLYGAWVESGLIDLDLSIGELGISDIGGLLPIEKKATIRDLLTAKSGVYHPASNAGDNLADAPDRGTVEPGSHMLYSNWDFNVAGTVFEMLTETNIYDEVERQIAIPLRFEDWDRSVQRKTGDLSISIHPAYHMWFSTRDLARVGLLMLTQGAWDGRQIIPHSWYQTITHLETPLNEMNPPYMRERYMGYGYMWWLWDGPLSNGPFKGAFLAAGAYGQWIAVLPALDLVIATKTKYAYRRRTSWAQFERTMELILQSRGITEGFVYPWDRTILEN